MSSDLDFDWGGDGDFGFLTDGEASPELSVAEWAAIKQALMAKVRAGSLQAITLLFRMVKMPAYQAACEAAHAAREWPRSAVEPSRESSPEPLPTTSPVPVASPVQSAVRPSRAGTESAFAPRPSEWGDSIGDPPLTVAAGSARAPALGTGPSPPPKT